MSYGFHIVKETEINNCLFFIHYLSLILVYSNYIQQNASKRFEMNHTGYYKKINTAFMMGLTALAFYFPAMVQAGITDKVDYRIVDRQPNYNDSRRNFNQSMGSGSYRQYADAYGTPLNRPAPQYYPQHPPRPPHHGYPPSGPYPVYPQQNGVTIIYNHQFPTQTGYRSETRSFVNGDAHSSIESTRYTIISDWRRYNLPAPAAGTHWIYQDGRYLQVPNQR